MIFYMYKLSDYSKKILEAKGIDPDKDTEMTVENSNISYHDAHAVIKHSFSEKVFNKLNVGGTSVTKFKSINKQIDEYTKTLHKKQGFVVHGFAFVNNKLESIALEVAYEEPIVELKYEISNIEMEKLAMIFIENKCDMQKTLEVAMTHAYIQGAQHGGMDSSLFNKALKANLE